MIVIKWIKDIEWFDIKSGLVIEVLGGRGMAPRYCNIPQSKGQFPAKTILTPRRDKLGYYEYYFVRESDWINKNKDMSRAKKVNNWFEAKKYIFPKGYPCYQQIKNE